MRKKGEIAFIHFSGDASTMKAISDGLFDAWGVPTEVTSKVRALEG